MNKILVRAIEKATGMPIEEVRRTPLAELRDQAEAKHGPQKVDPPLISHEEVERRLTQSLQ